MFTPTYLPERVDGTESLGALEIPYGIRQSQRSVVWIHAKIGPSQIGDVITPPSLWSTSGPLSCGFSKQDFPHQPFLGHSGYVLEQCSWDLSVQRSGATFRILHIVDFVATRHTVNSSHQNNLCFSELITTV